MPTVMGLAMTGIWILGRLLLGCSTGCAAWPCVYLHLAGYLPVSSVDLCTAYVYGLLKPVVCQFIAVSADILGVSSQSTWDGCRQ